MKTLKLSVVAAMLATNVAFADNVMVYDQAPSVEELRQQLLGNQSAAQKTGRTRAIVFGESPAAASQETQQTAQPAAAPPRPSTQQAYAPPPPATAAQPQVSDRAIAFPITFRVNSAEILPESVPFLESIAGLLTKDSGIRLVVEGHTDSTGNLSRNLSLSRERAFSVMNYLIDHYSIDPLRLIPVGKASSEPLGGLEPTNPKNRRVQFRIMG